MVNHRIITLFEQISGAGRWQPRGHDMFRDIHYSLPNLRIKTAFDVGANVGQSAARFVKWFPDAEIYCFEPGHEAFFHLQKFQTNAHCHHFKLALGKERGRGRLAHTGGSDMSFMLKGPQTSTLDVEEVAVETVDDFCLHQNILYIGYLKVDTEGGDLEVIQGAAGMLEAKRIDVIELEAGMNGGNHRHVPFEDLKSFCESKEYFLFGIYEQVPEWPANEAHLRRANVVFISQKVINAHKAPL